MTEENRASDYPQPSTIRKSPHIRGFRQSESGGEELPPILHPPTPNMSYMVGHLARPYDSLMARRLMFAHVARDTVEMTYAAQRMITHLWRGYTPEAATVLMIAHSAVV